MSKPHILITGAGSDARLILSSLAVRATAAPVVVPRDKDAAVTCRDAGVELVMAADQKWEVDVPTKFQWMPGGVSLVTPSYGGRTIRMAVLCDESTARAVQASFDRWRKTMPKQRPFGCVEHREQEAAFLPTHFEWDTERNGVACCGTPTALGAQNVNGRIHRSWSPTFTTDADYESCKCSDCGLGWDGCDAAKCEGVMEFPDGVRGSLQNPAQVTGVAFSVGSLTNKPAFRNIDPVRARDGSVTATWSDAAREAALAARRAKAHQTSYRGDQGMLHRVLKKHGYKVSNMVDRGHGAMAQSQTSYEHPDGHHAVISRTGFNKHATMSHFTDSEDHAGDIEMAVHHEKSIFASDPGVRASGTSEGAKKGWEHRFHPPRTPAQRVEMAKAHLEAANDLNTNNSGKLNLENRHEEWLRAHGVVHKDGEIIESPENEEIAKWHNTVYSSTDTTTPGTVRATWSDAARQAAAEARKREGGGLLRRKHEQARRGHLEEAEQAGKDYANAGTEDEMDATHKTRVAHLASAKAYETGSEVHHYAASLAHLAAKQAMDKVNDEGMGRGHLAHAQVHDALAHNETTHNWVTASLGADKDSVRAHCKDNLYADVPDATEAEAAAYDACVDGGGSHQQAVAELRKKRNPANEAVQSSDEVLARLAGTTVKAAGTSEGARKSWVTRRIGHTLGSRSPESVTGRFSQDAADASNKAEQSGNPADHREAANLHGQAANRHYQAASKAYENGAKDGTARFHEMKSEQHMQAAKEHMDAAKQGGTSGGYQHASDAILAKLAQSQPPVRARTSDEILGVVKASGTSEGARKGWEYRKSAWFKEAGQRSERAATAETEHKKVSQRLGNTAAHVETGHVHRLAGRAWDIVASLAKAEGDHEGAASYKAKSEAHYQQGRRHRDLEQESRRKDLESPGGYRD